VSSLSDFPAGFLWGVATSAQQIEGATDEGGRGESVWDRFAATPGRVADGSTPRIACDHWHRWREDVALLSWLGVRAYRFSVSWPRVLPTGRGAPLTAGLDRYDALVDALLEAGIRPLLTLDHWDLPQALQEEGGWSSRSCVDAFTAYTEAVSRRLGDRVSMWVTHNEPWCISHLGWEVGAHAPGRRDAAASLRVAHHLLVAHGRAVEVLRRNAPRAEVGIVLILSPIHAASQGAADVDAARRLDGSLNRWFLDPLFRAAYPGDALLDRVRLGQLADTSPEFMRDGDLACAAAPCDFLGINYYSRNVVRAGAGGEPESVRVAPPEALTAMGWEVYPEGLEEILLRVQRDYAPRRVLVTENGAAWPDGPGPEGHLADPRRVAYLRAHVEALGRAARAGVPVAGYFVWSLLDNFEWAEGFSKRFGLFHVDFATQRRSARESAYWYRDIVARGVTEDVPGPHNARRSP